MPRVRKSASVPAVEPAVVAPVVPVVVEVTPPVAEPEPVTPSARKPKLVRDSFTVPKAEYQRIEALKERAAALGRPIKKSELLRAGIKLLDALPDDALMQAMAEVPSIKTGRPGKASR